MRPVQQAPEKGSVMQIKHIAQASTELYEEIPTGIKVQAVLLPAQLFLARKMTKSFLKEYSWKKVLSWNANVEWIKNHRALSTAYVAVTAASFVAMKMTEKALLTEIPETVIELVEGPETEVDNDLDSLKLDFIVKEAYDMIELDFENPDEDGREAVEYLRKVIAAAQEGDPVKTYEVIMSMYFSTTDAVKRAMENLLYEIDVELPEYEDVSPWGEVEPRDYSIDYAVDEEFSTQTPDMSEMYGACILSDFSAALKKELSDAEGIFPLKGYLWDLEGTLKTGNLAMVQDMLLEMIHSGDSEVREAAMRIGGASRTRSVGEVISDYTALQESNI